MWLFPWIPKAKVLENSEPWVYIINHRVQKDVRSCQEWKVFFPPKGAELASRWEGKQRGDAWCLLTLEGRWEGVQHPHSPPPPNKRHPSLLPRDWGDPGRERHPWAPLGVALDTAHVMAKSGVQHGLFRGAARQRNCPNLGPGCLAKSSVSSNVQSPRPSKGASDGLRWAVAVGDQ